MSLILQFILLALSLQSFMILLQYRKEFWIRSISAFICLAIGWGLAYLSWKNPFELGPFGRVVSFFGGVFFFLSWLGCFFVGGASSGEAQSTTSYSSIGLPTASSYGTGPSGGDFEAHDGADGDGGGD